MTTITLRTQASADRVIRSFRVSPSTVDMIARIQHVTGLSQARILEEALLNLADAIGVETVSA